MLFSHILKIQIALSFTVLPRRESLYTFTGPKKDFNNEI